MQRGPQQAGVDAETQDTKGPQDFKSKSQKPLQKQKAESPKPLPHSKSKFKNNYNKKPHNPQRVAQLFLCPWLLPEPPCWQDTTGPANAVCRWRPLAIHC